MRDHEKRLAMLDIALLAAVILIALAFALPDKAQPQPQQYPTLMHAMFANGYQTAIVIDHFERTPAGCGGAGAPPCRITAVTATYPANPNAVLPQDRYGYGTHPNMGSVGGGESANCEVIDAFVHGGYLPGFNDPNYSCDAPGHQQDISDTYYLKGKFHTTAYGDMLAAWHPAPPEPTPTATPPSPQPTATPAPTPTPCPDCPPVPSCAPVDPACSAAIWHVAAGDWTLIGAGRRAAFKRCPKPGSTGRLSYCVAGGVP